MSRDHAAVPLLSDSDKFERPRKHDLWTDDYGAPYDPNRMNCLDCKEWLREDEEDYCTACLKKLGRVP